MNIFRAQILVHLHTCSWMFPLTIGIWYHHIQCEYFIQNLPIHQNIFSVHVTYESILFNASKNNLNKMVEFVLLCLSFWPCAGFHVKQFFFWTSCFIFSSWDSNHTGSTESDDDGKQLNTTDTQHIQYNHNSLDFYHWVEKGYKSKTCELLPSVRSGGQSQHKFGKVAVKSLTDHPKHLLRGHETFQKHINTVKELAGISNFSILFSLSGFLEQVNAKRH